MLLPSHYMADMHGDEWLIGPGKALDAGKQFLIATELWKRYTGFSPPSLGSRI